MKNTTIVVQDSTPEVVRLQLSGRWQIDASVPDVAAVDSLLLSQWPGVLALLPGEGFQWDSRLLAFIMSLQTHCHHQNCRLDIGALPGEVRQLFTIANAVPPKQEEQKRSGSFGSTVIAAWRKIPEELLAHLIFSGEMTQAFFSELLGSSKVRWSETLKFCYQAGPSAVPIITLQSVLVGMILAYLGIIQLQQFGAEVYISDLVAIGMVREMGPLMTGIIMSGRTGASYAAQIGTMQVNEEVDALTTLGIKPVEYLVLPRMTALLLCMPLLGLYSNLLGMLGGGLIATGMDMTWRIYLYQLSHAITATDVVSGLFKSVVFAQLIAVAGCRAGLNCGRSSAAVGEATTSAVVTAIIYLVVADAALNLLYFQLGV